MINNDPSNTESPDIPVSDQSEDSGSDLIPGGEDDSLEDGAGLEEVVGTDSDTPSIDGIPNIGDFALMFSIISIIAAVVSIISIISLWSIFKKA